MTGSLVVVMGMLQLFGIKRRGANVVNVTRYLYLAGDYAVMVASLQEQLL